MSTDSGGKGAGFVHHASLYDGDEAFLAMALPFAEEGLDAGEPVLAATTPANIELLRDALGARAHALDTAETAYFGRRPVERVSSFLRYVNRRHVRGRRTRIIAEPLWAGKSARQIAEWKRMESGLNVLLADSDVWMICPYDTRTVPEDVAQAAVATHPAHVVGAKILPCAAYVDPDAYAAAADAPLLPPPVGADRLDGPATPAAVRAFVRGSAAAAGLSGARLAMAETVANEALTCLLERGATGAEVCAWEEPGIVAWDLFATGPATSAPAAWAGFVPPGEQAGPFDGLWLMRSLCESVEIRMVDGRMRLRLRYGGKGNAERL
ncbi:MEDS domain-containing protein [Streptomyces sp. ISL-99]|uniref:MEDS domain-containing protein n=1 Tax=Streptomyces sp. ISL-99 TaxID=2819193 RepID=UPI001BE61815|nr:MEDS domain-containing protein [Streptomyces sp. ISL-99]MBT2529117.1 MEDS domain-containing protein [Streptomyces sp. ISL-99]